MTTPDAPAAPAPGRRPAARVVFWATFALVFGISALWAIANPLMAAPDEPAHAIKAAAVVRGELLGDQAGAPVGSGLVDVPELFAQLKALPGCFAYQPEVPASCAPALQGDLAAPARTSTSAVRYSPVYYAVAGLPTLFGSSPLTLYAMRLIGALLGALLIAFAFRTIAEMRHRAWVMLGATAAITPMVIFLNGTINPQSLEIAAALLVWVAALSLLRDPDQPVPVAWLRRLAVGVALLATTRSLGPLFVLIIVAVVVMIGPWSRIRQVLTSRPAWPYLAICVLAGLASVAWVLITGTLDTGPEAVAYPELTGRNLVLTVLRDSWAYLQNSLGVFGWNDTGLPGWGYLLVAAPLSLMALIGWAAGGRRHRLAMLGLGLVIFVLPFVAQYAEARYINLFWQGRYGLPLLVGIPVVAGFAAAKLERELPAWFAQRLAAAALLCLAVGQLLGFVVSLQRNVNGTAGGYLQPGPGAWSPPLNPYLLIALVALGWLALTRVWLAGGRPADESPGPATPADAPTGPDQGTETARQPIKVVESPGFTGDA